MKVTIAGSRYFGQQVLNALVGEKGVTINRVVALAADDRLAVL